MRTGLSVLAIAAAISLVLVFEGFRVGLYQQLRDFPASLPGDLVVLQAGVNNLAGARSVLPQSVRKEVESVGGVARVHPLAGIPLIYERKGKKLPAFVVAYDTAGGPVVTEGREISGPREVVFDKSLATKMELEVGDQIEVLDEHFELVGTSSDTSSMFNPYVFARYEDLIELYLTSEAVAELPFEPAILSHLLVDLEPGASVDAVRAGIEAASPDADVATTAELGEADVAMGKRMMDPVLGFLVGVAWAVGVLVVGLTVYASVQARVRELGVMRALGAAPARLVRGVLLEAVVLTGLAFVVAMGASAGMAAVVETLRPNYAVSPLVGSVLLRTGVACVGIALVGSLLPMRRVQRVDPAMVFRGGA